MKRLFVWSQYVLPKQRISQLLGWLARKNLGFVTRWVIRRFIGDFNVDMTEALHSNPLCYKTFNDFFTRPLREGVRQIDMRDDILVSPVDGHISECGEMRHATLLQAKGRIYSRLSLLANDADLSHAMARGTYFTVYLSPRDYHRVHMPITGKLVKMIYVPGNYFSVKPIVVESIDSVFAKNERVICEFMTAVGRLVVILVGAMVVGSMATVWHGVVKPRGRKQSCWNYEDENIVLQKGEEMGRFQLGSTVVMLFQEDAVELLAQHEAGELKLGQAIARI